MTSEHPLAWLALGVALGSQTHLARLLAEQSPEDFSQREARGLFEALGQGAAAVRTILSGLGVPPLGGKPADAVLDALKQSARKRRQEEIAAKVADAARLLPPEKFVEYLSRQVAELRESPPVAGKITEAV